MSFCNNLYVPVGFVFKRKLDIVDSFAKRLLYVIDFLIQPLP